MIDTNVALSQQVGIVGVIDPDNYTAGTVTTGWINMAEMERIQAVVMVGTLGTSATVDAKLEQALDGSGASAKDVSDKAITQLTQAGGDDRKQAVIELKAEELDVANGFGFVRLSITIGTAASDVGGLVLGAGFRYGPATDRDLVSVVEVVD